LYRTVTSIRSAVMWWRCTLRTIDQRREINHTFQSVCHKYLNKNQRHYVSLFKCTNDSLKQQSTGQHNTH